MKEFELDRAFIANKYHWQNQPFDPYKRMAYHGYDYDESTGLCDEQIIAGLEQMREELSTLAHPIAKAKAVRYVLQNTRIDVGEHDYFPGLYSLNRLANRVTQDVWQKELFTEILPETKAQMRDMCSSHAATIWPDFDHVVPDWDSILSLGFVGLKDRAKAYAACHEADGSMTAQMRAHFDGIDLLYEGILELLQRLIDYADKQTHAKAKTVSKGLKTLTKGAPTTFYEALLTIYLFFIVCECFDSFQVRSLCNGMDDQLYAFYERDLANGVSREQIRTYLAYFMFQWSAIGNYWGQPFYLGGTNADGSSKYNELSRDILTVYGQIGVYNPKIQLKINENTPEWVLDTAFDLIKEGKTNFAFCCEPGYWQAVMGYGATEEEARTFDIRGCYETGVRANEVVSTTGYVNSPKAVQYAFSNGYEPLLGKVYGLQTGEAEQFASFDEFYQAVKAQWGKLIEQSMAVAKEYEPYFSFINPSLMYSSTIKRSLESGRDAYQNGVKFNNSSVLNCGFATLVDAVAAVKYLVFDTKTATMSQLKQALDADWVGYEALRAKALKCPCKYGNGNAQADEIARDLAVFFADKVNGKPNGRGGVYKAEMHTAMMFVWQGEKTPATPDGRKGGDEIAKNGSPSIGMDRNGVTAAIRSALALTPSLYREAFCLDVMVDSSAVEGEDGNEILKALLFTYLKGGGMTLQINVFSADKLKDAQLHPEKYENLQVRVCGWNVSWNNLSKKEQDAYLLRAQNGNGL